MSEDNKANKLTDENLSEVNGGYYRPKPIPGDPKDFEKNYKQHQKDYPFGVDMKHKNRKK